MPEAGDEYDEYPRFVTAKSKIGRGGVGPGDVMEFYFAASYPADAPGSGGTMRLEIHCPEGLSPMETGWSTRAHLVSDVSMNGTWVRSEIYPEGVPVAEYSAQADAAWDATLPDGDFTFIASRPLAGRATLVSSDGEFSCGPPADLGAVEGRAFCRHTFGGGETTVHVTRSSVERIGPSTTAQTWMAVIAEMEHYDWSHAS